VDDGTGVGFGKEAQPQIDRRMGGNIPLGHRGRSPEFQSRIAGTISRRYKGISLIQVTDR
jgi:hypothetical protein